MPETCEASVLDKAVFQVLPLCWAQPRSRSWRTLAQLLCHSIPEGLHRCGAKATDRRYLGGEQGRRRDNAPAPLWVGRFVSKILGDTHERLETQSQVPLQPSAIFGGAHSYLVFG